MTASKLANRDALCQTLGVTWNQVTGILYGKRPASFYSHFTIPKRSGGQRLISAPTGSLLLIQQKLAQVLQDHYEPRHSTQGYVRGRSVVTNAAQHVGKRWVLNIDLINFFPTISYGRVLGLFKARPFDLADDIAHVLTKLCTFQNALPIGAPTSPVISNLICRQLDMDLQSLTSKMGCWYTRYADDITISTDRKTFPRAHANATATGDISAGEGLLKLVTRHGFEINAEKTRLQGRGRRQVVTGLSVAHHLNVQTRFRREIRGMIHAWNRYGLADVQRKHDRRLDAKRFGRSNPKPYDQILKGKVGFLAQVLGDDNIAVRRFRLQIKNLEANRAINEGLAEIVSANKVRVLHLSDFHFCKKNAWDSKPLLERLIEQVRSLPRPDLVVVTGDIADRGTSEDYAFAKEFLLELLRAVELDVEHLLMVPGNHDVERPVVNDTSISVQERVLTRSSAQTEFATVMNDDLDSQSIGRRMRAYQAFESELRGTTRTRLWWHESFTLNGVTTSIAGLNSALFSSSDKDKGSLFLGLLQCNEVLVGEAELKIALVHHPLDYLADVDRSSEAELTKWADLVLRGHLHEEAWMTASNEAGSVCFLAAGAAYQGSTWKGGYELLTYDSDSRTVEIDARRWSPNNRQWYKSEDAFHEGSGLNRITLAPL